MANRAWVLAVALLCAACGGSADGDDDNGSGSGGSGGSESGKGGGGGSAGTTSQTTQEAVARLQTALPLVCDQTELCYGTRCEGPTATGEHAVWPNSELPPLYFTCFEELADQYPELVTWANCAAQSEEDETACLNDCPTTVDACLTAGNEAIASCREGTEGALEAVGTCTCMADPAAPGCSN